ncbi:alpha-beta hydrolase superfamily lysophospholipase [Arthrobacter sp. V1I7]|nr:alpha-beta hydrolase superfamily lysophospholipase [Arthrobacter sp. V1I7]
MEDAGVAIRKEDDREAQEAGSGAAAKAVLSVAPARGETRGVALVLHGGTANSYEFVRGRHLSPARMVPFAQTLRARGGLHGLSVWTLRNRYRGWNGADMSPVQDARWALSHIRREHPDLPVYLLGHSMGGLTALCVADDPQVRAVVALAPWLNRDTPVQRVAGRRVLIVHGTEDRWTSPSNSLAYARRPKGVAESVDYVSLTGAGHFMVRRLGLWNSLASGYILDAFADDSGAEVQRSREAFRTLLPAARASLPVVL